MSARYTKYLTIERASLREREVEHIQIEVSILQEPFSTPEQPALFGDCDQQRQSILDFSDSSRPPLERRHPVIATQFIHPFSHHFSDWPPSLWSDVVTDELKDSTLELLRSYDPNILDIDLVLCQRGDALVHEHPKSVSLLVTHQRLGRAPLSSFGNGFRRLFTLTAALAQCRDGCMLIDELEASLHARALRSTMEWLVRAC